MAIEHEIYIYDISKDKADGIQIPWLPSEIEFDLGGMRMMKYEIMDLGEVNVPSGQNLGTIKFKSLFPGEGRKGLPFLRGSFKEPDLYQNQLTAWMINGTKLKVIVTGTPINHEVYVTSFVPVYSGGYGDITYELELKCRREITIKTITTKKTGTAKKSKTVKKTTKTYKTHKVKRGDTLWAIARKYLGSGSKYKSIYNLNKSVIESTAKKRGYKSSSGGHWIFPGTVLKIPK